MRKANQIGVDPGTLWTTGFAILYYEPTLTAIQTDPCCVDLVRQWITALGIVTLNCAGASVTIVHDIDRSAEHFLRKVFAQ